MTDAVEDAAAAAELKPTPIMAQSISSGATPPAQAQVAEASETQQDIAASNPIPDQITPQDPSTTTTLSKNQVKKLKKKQEWEATRDDRKERRRIKAKARKERRRADPEVYSNWQQTKRTAAANATQTPVPITIVYDCGYDELMTENELVSLAAQLTRAYSDNRKAVWRPKMVVSTFSGRLKERFKTVLHRTNESWKGVEFLDGDFVEAARRAGEMRGEIGDSWRGCGALAGEHAAKVLVHGLKVEDVKEEEEEDTNGFSTLPNHFHTASSKPPAIDALSDTSTGETIYLSSDSPNTLTSLKPHSTYIIGALVDKNRHKGACYKAACSKNVKTARLPISEFMQMRSRQILATSHVGEIMLKWLEYGDWGRAFMEVIPTRKGGVLKEDRKSKGKGSDKKMGDGQVKKARVDRGSVEDCVIGDDDEEDDDSEEDNEDEDDDMIEDGKSEEDQEIGGDSRKRKPPEDIPSESAEPPPNKRIQA